MTQVSFTNSDVTRLIFLKSLIFTRNHRIFKGQKTFQQCHATFRSNSNTNSLIKNMTVCAAKVTIPFLKKYFIPSYSRQTLGFPYPLPPTDFPFIITIMYTIKSIIQNSWYDFFHGDVALISDNVLIPGSVIIFLHSSTCLPLALINSNIQCILLQTQMCFYILSASLQLFPWHPPLYHPVFQMVSACL